MFEAIILAGGESNKLLGQAVDQPYEALIELNGKPMVSFVAEALASSGIVERLLVVGPEHALRKCVFPDNTVVLQGGQTIMQTIKAGVAHLCQTKKVLVATADIPLITPEAITHFVNECSKVEADLYYPIVEKKLYQLQYPGSKRTYVRLKEGTYTGGNLFMVDPAIVPNCLEAAERIIAHRKSPLTICYMLGISFLLKFVSGLLTIDAAEKRVSGLLGIKGAVIQSPYPEIGIDIDKPSDLELAQMAIAPRG